MELEKLMSLEMENISRSDVELLSEMSCILGACGIKNGWGACGDDRF